MADNRGAGWWVTTIAGGIGLLLLVAEADTLTGGGRFLANLVQITICLAIIELALFGWRRWRRRTQAVTNGR